MQNDFGIRTRLECVPKTLELVAELDIIVDLPIEDDLQLPIFIADRLGSPLDIDDREPAVPQPDLSVDERALPIRPAMAKHSHHSAHERRVDRTTRRIKHSANSTHEVLSDARRWIRMRTA